MSIEEKLIQIVKKLPAIYIQNADPKEREAAFDQVQKKFKGIKLTGDRTVNHFAPFQLIIVRPFSSSSCRRNVGKHIV